MQRWCTTSTRNSFERKRGELVGDAAVAEHRFRFQGHALQALDVLFAEPIFGSFESTPPLRTRRRLRRGLHELVPVEDLLGDGLRAVQSRDRREEFVRAYVLALDHSSPRRT